jgi:hypothetical protein
VMSKLKRGCAFKLEISFRRHHWVPCLKVCSIGELVPFKIKLAILSCGNLDEKHEQHRYRSKDEPTLRLLNETIPTQENPRFILEERPGILDDSHRVRF